MLIHVLEPRISAAILLVLSAGALYFASRAAMRAAIAPHASSPGRRALCQWLPIAATSIAAILTHHPAVAVAVVFGTSVAYLSLVLGMSTYVAPMNPDLPRPKVWAFVLAPVLLALLAGFDGALSAVHAGMLVILGVTILALWREDAATGTFSAEAKNSPALKLDWMRWLQVFVALGLACVAGRVAVGAAVSAAQQATLPNEMLVGLSVLSPMLILPSLRTCVTVAERGDVQGAVSAVIGTVLLNLCVLLPLIVLLWYPVSGISIKTLGLFQPATTDLYAPAQGLIYPGGIWRLETIVLVVLGFGLIPVALGRLTLARVESALLVLGYAAYLAAVAWSAKRA